MPAYRRLHEFFVETYLPATRKDPGIWAYPGGLELYGHLVRHYTTTEMTPEEVHAVGVREVERIRGLMLEIIDQVGFKEGFAAFLQHLRTAPEFYFEKPEDLLEAYRATSKRIDPEIVKLFGRLPRMPYGVRPIPDAVAPDTTTAYYSQPAADGSRAGYYYVNFVQARSATQV